MVLNSVDRSAVTAIPFGRKALMTDLGFPSNSTDTENTQKTYNRRFKCTKELMF